MNIAITDREGNESDEGAALAKIQISTAKAAATRADPRSAPLRLLFLTPKRS
jgi:hypothetical protein